MRSEEEIRAELGRLEGDWWKALCEDNNSDLTILRTAILNLRWVLEIKK